jgi:hypothetical protein
MPQIAPWIAGGPPRRPGTPGGVGTGAGGNPVSDIASGGQGPAILPIALAVGVTSLTPTSAILVGLVDEEGLAGQYWFTYGTTPLMGTITGMTTLPALTNTTTVQAPVTGLLPGLTYYFAVVVSTAGGTVTSTPLLFSTTVPGTLSTVDFSPDVAIPHFTWPFTITAQGAVVAQQDSDAEINSCVATIVNCFQGDFPENPGFGIPDQTFSPTPLDTSGLETSILVWETRATDEAIAAQIPDGTTGTWGIDITTQTEA